MTDSDDFKARREALSDKGSIAEFGGCVWTYWDGGPGRDQVESDLERWGEPNEDPVAIEHLENLIELAENGGLLRSNFKAPCGAMTGRLVGPWIGELKSQGMKSRGNEGTRAYRLYFAEVPLVGPSLLAAKLAWKCSKWTDEVTETNQTSQIASAMGITRAHARTGDGTYREVDWSL